MLSDRAAAPLTRKAPSPGAQLSALEALLELSAAEAATAIAAGGLTSVALTRALAIQARAMSGLNALIGFDEARALQAAEALDTDAEAGRWHGPLHGVPIVVKDNINAQGMPTTAGTPALDGFVPAENAPVLQKLIDAGAVLLAKTNMHELAFGITSNNARFGAVRNAYDPRRFAGGSSGGTGAAIAARVAPAGLGTDTGGSVRIPAALNGIAGFRPTAGRYSNAGIVPISTTRDTAGPMARRVADLVLLDGVIVGTDTALSPANLKRVRLGIAKTLLADLDPETARVFTAAVDRLKTVGVEIVDADFPEMFELNAKISLTVAAYEFNRDLATFLAEHRAGIDFPGVVAQVASPDVRRMMVALFAESQALQEERYRLALTQSLPALQKRYADYFASHRVEALIFPTTPLPAAAIEGHDDVVELNGRLVPTFFTFIRLTDPGSNAGIPGLSIPIGLTKDGLPIGLELDGPAGSDRRLLALALAMEDLFGLLPKP